MTKQVVGYCNDDGNAMATNLDYQKKNLSQLNHEQIKRRRNTVLRSTKPCPFQFRKKVDTIGFYISLYNGSGNSYHQGTVTLRRKLKKLFTFTPRKNITRMNLRINFAIVDEQWC